MMKKIVYITVLLTVLCLALPFSGTLSAEETVCSVVIPKTEVNGNEFTGGSVDVFAGDTFYVYAAVKRNKNHFDLSGSGELSYALGEELTLGEVTDIPYDDTADFRMDVVKIEMTAVKAGNSKAVVSCVYNGATYFASIDINVIDADAEVEIVSDVLEPYNGAKVTFTALLNGSKTLCYPAADYVWRVGGERIGDGRSVTYTVPEGTDSITVSVEADGKTTERTYSVLSTAPAEYIRAEKAAYSYLLKDGKATMNVSVNKGCKVPFNVFVGSDGVTYDGKYEYIDTVGDKDRYSLSFSLNSEIYGGKVMIKLGDSAKFDIIDVNVIDKINTLTVRKSDSAKYGEEATFYAVINGIEGVETEVKWTINGAETTGAATLTRKMTHTGANSVTAAVGDVVSGELTFDIDIGRGNALWIVIICVLVIAIFVPVIIALRKEPKVNIKDAILKQNETVVKRAEKMLEYVKQGNTKLTRMTRYASKLAIACSRSYRMCQQENFEGSNSAFSGAYARMEKVKGIGDDLLIVFKNKPQETEVMLDRLISMTKEASAIVERIKRTDAQLKREQEKK